MIIFGTRGRDSQVGQGRFNCPQCRMQRAYEHKSVKRYFTLYFIPVLPLGSAGEYVRCESCGGTFGTEILTYDPEQERAKTVSTLRRMAVLFLLDLKRASAQELENLQDIVGEVADSDIEAIEVAQDVRMAHEADVDLIQHVKRETDELTDEGKWLLLWTVRRILEKSRPLAAHERERLLEVGRAIGLKKKPLIEFLDAPLDTGETRA